MAPTLTTLASNATAAATSTTVAAANVVEFVPPLQSAPPPTSASASLNGAAEEVDDSVALFNESSKEAWSTDISWDKLHQYEKDDLDINYYYNPNDFNCKPMVLTVA